MAPIYFQDFLASEEMRRETWRRRFAMDRHLRQAEPNRGHRAVATLVRRGTVASVITQNIDGLHQASGVPDRQVIELHGNTTYAHCLDCGARYELERSARRSSATGEAAGLQRVRGPGEDRDDLLRPVDAGAAMRRAEAETLAADLFIALGSSLVVYPAAGFPELAKHNGAKLVIVNREQTGLDRYADLVLHEPIGDTLGGAVGNN